MKLLIIGILALAVGSLIGYGGSYILDSNFLYNKPEVFKHFLQAEKSEVLSVETSNEISDGGNSDNNGMDNDVGPALTSTLENSISMSVSPTPNITLTPVPTTTLPFAPSTPSTTVSPASSSQEINGYIEKYAMEYGVDPHILRGVAMCESGFNPLAAHKNYAGLYQFTPNTWKVNRSEMQVDQNPELRFNAEESVKTAAYMLSVGKRRAWPVC